MATYPTAVKSFTSKLDRVDDANAADVNVAYDEISAVQSTVGVTPATSVSNLATSWNGATSYNWGTVKARLDNIERGVRGDAHGSLYVHQAGGDTIQTFDTSVVPLTVRSALNTAVNLWQVQDGSGNNAIHVDNANMQLHQSGQVVPYITKCGTLSLLISSGNTSGTGTVTFGDFTAAPIVITTVNADSSLALANAVAYDVTTTSATVTVNLTSAAGSNTTVHVFWVAIQGLRTGSTAGIP